MHVVKQQAFEIVVNLVPEMSLLNMSLDYLIADFSISQLFGLPFFVNILFFSLTSKYFS